MANEYYQMGSGLGDAYLEGQKISKDREEAAARAKQMGLQTQLLEGRVADDQSQRARNTEFYQGIKDLDAPGSNPTAGLPSAAAPPAAPPPTPNMGAPGAPTQGEGAQGLPVPGGAPAGAPGAPGGAPAIPQLALTRGDRTWRQAKLVEGLGKFEEANTLRKQARTENIEDTFNHGATAAKNPAMRDAAFAFVNQQDPTLTFAKDERGYTRLSMPDPARPGQAVSMPLSEGQISQLMGAQALMQGGFAREGLAEFEKVNKDLAAHIGVRNGLVEKVATTNNSAQHQENQDAAAFIKANAEKARADNEIKGSKMSVLQPTTDSDGNTVLNVGVMGKDGSIKVISSPTGMKSQKQVDPVAVQKLADSLVGTPMVKEDGSADLDASGKPKKYDVLGANRTAMQQLYGADSRGGKGAQGGGFTVPGNVSPSAAAAAAKGGKSKGLPVPEGPAPRAPGADGRTRGASGKLAMMTDKELAEIPPGNSSYEAAQEELGIRAEDKSANSGGAGNFSQY